MTDTAAATVILSEAREAGEVEGSSSKTAADLQFSAALDAYLAEHGEEMLADIATLVAIPSTEDLDDAAPGAPWGPEPARALEAALGIAARLGFEPCNMDGYVGYADAPAGRSAREDVPAGREASETAPGAALRTLGIIGHVDVVPQCPGWATDPFTMVRRDGYVFGRGVLDDKGPLLMAMHALRCVRRWGDAHPQDALPFDTRVIIGCNEETGMGDVAYYRAHEADPDFLFTPDAEFPIGYGEKGIYQATLVSAPVAADAAGIMEFAGGSATNAVPGEARAVVRGFGEVSAVGKTAHAAMPETGESAILRLIAGLLENPIAAALTEPERDFLSMIARVTCVFDGRGADLACADEDFGALTLVGGVIALERGEDGEDGEDGSGSGDGDGHANGKSGTQRITQTIDIRYPTCITADEIAARLLAAATEVGATLRPGKVEEPFLTSADSPEVQALFAAYRDVTGDTQHGPFTMGGGTYARKFTRGVSFGMERPWVGEPDFVGGMHGPNEAVSEAALFQAFKVYATALRNLAKL